MVSELTLGEVGVNALPTLWADIESLLTEACSWSAGAFTPQSVVDAMMAGRLQMLALADARVRSIMVVSIELFPSGLKVLECLLTSGQDMKDWLPYEPELDDLAKGLGCARVRAVGRKGLAKALPHWKMIGVMLERDIG